MKKILSIILSLSITLCLIPNAIAAYTDTDTSSDYNESLVRLADLGILSGYEDGTFRPHNTITRAEFTKTVVYMMGKEDEASASATFSSFHDVPNGIWSAKYINYAVNQGILSGYSDGSFAPDKTITLAEAVTILLRTAGYTDEDVGYFWPNNYMDAAVSLGLTEGMNFEPSAILSRSTAAILVDRTMFIKPANAQNSDTYLETIGYTVLDDALVIDIDSPGSNISLLSGNLKVNSASTYINRTTKITQSGDTFAHAVIDKNGYLVALKEYTHSPEICSQVATINKLTGNTLEYTTMDGIRGNYKADDSFPIYYGSSKLNFSQAKNYITNGVDITFYGDNYGLWNIAVIGSGNDIDPVLASRSYSQNSDNLEGISINHQNLVVYRNGEASSLSEIEIQDVVYYNTKSNVMDVYSKKVTGSYYSAYPSKAYVESVTVSGKSYTIGHHAATSKLDASQDAFAIGDKITLLLGKNDEIAFVTDNSSAFDYFEYGVLLSSTTQEASSGANEGSTEIVAEMFMPDGEIHSIITNKSYKNNVGDLMHITYTNGVAQLKPQNLSNPEDYSGDINISTRTIGERYLLKDAAIIQLNSTDTASTAECELLDFDNLTASTISAGQIIGAVTANNFGDIAILFVKNLDNNYTYGVISGFNKVAGEAGKTLTGYKIFSDSTSTEYSLSSVSKINTSLGSGVAYKTSGGMLTKLVALKKIKSASSITAVEGSRIKLGSTIYKLSNNVQIVDITSTSNMRTITIDELSSAKKISQVCLYSEAQMSSDSVVCVITVAYEN